MEQLIFQAENDGKINLSVYGFVHQNIKANIS